MLKINAFEIKGGIDDLVTQAFDKVYIRSKDCWVNVENIELEYSCNDPEDLYPLVYVTVRFANKFISDEPQELCLRIDLEESYDFNVGHLTSAFERVEDDD